MKPILGTQKTNPSTATWAGAHIAHLRGILDFGSRDELDRALSVLAGSEAAIIDLLDVTYADSALVNSVAAMLRKRPAHVRDEAIRIVGAQAVVRRIFHAGGLGRFVSFHDSLRDAQEVPANQPIAE